MTEKDREDFILMKSDVQDTKFEIEKIHTKVSSIDDEFKKISFHLIGDSSTETKGWIWKLNRFDGRLTLMEKTITIGVGLFSAFLVYIGFVKNLFGIF